MILVYLPFKMGLKTSDSCHRSRFVVGFDKPLVLRSAVSSAAIHLLCWQKSAFEPRLLSRFEKAGCRPTNYVSSTTEVARECRQYAVIVATGISNAMAVQYARVARMKKSAVCSSPHAAGCGLRTDKVLSQITETRPRPICSWSGQCPSHCNHSHLRS